MPRPKHRLDAILREQAKNILSRTPAQGWLKPERVEVSTWPVDLIEVRGNTVLKGHVDGEALRFVLDSPKNRFSQPANRVHPSPDLLEQFLRLESASAPQIQQFASRFGALLVFYRKETRKVPDKVVVFESCAVWKYFAASMRSLLRIASCYHSDRRPDPSDWDRIGTFPEPLAPHPQEKDRDLLSSTPLGEEAWTDMAYFVRKGSDRDRKMWARLLNVLLDLGRVRPWLILERAETSARPKLVFSGPNLLSYLTLQLCLTASKHDAFAVCSYCNRQYPPMGRAPKTGQRNFCPDCRAAGVPVRVAQQARRERLREANLQGA